MGVRSMSLQVGVVSGWESDIVRVLLRTGSYVPSIGDLLYVNEATPSGRYRTVLMEVAGFEGGLPPYASVPQTQAQSQYYLTECDVIAKARLFLEISGGSFSKASRPPVILSQVFLLRKGDAFSEEIMKSITSYASQEGVAVAMLRSGVAHSEADAREKHFENAFFRLNLKKLIPKHVLVSGQTGSGKTSSVMGLILKYAMESREPLGWLIVDRHGEYTPREGYVPGKFIAHLVNELRNNPALAEKSRVLTVRLAYTPTQSTGGVSTLPPYFDLVETPVAGSSVTLADFAMIEGVRTEQVTELEEFITTIMPALAGMREPLQHSERKKLVPEKVLKVDFQTDFVLGETPETATANALALVPLLVDNVIRHEGVGLARDKKLGLHRVLVDRGIDAQTSRLLRRLVLSKLGWRTRVHMVENSVIYVIDDSRSVIKVTETFKNPQELVCFLKSFISTFTSIHQVSLANYPWLALCREQDILVVKKEPGEDIGRIVEKTEDGWTVILDTSGVDSLQGDLVAVTVVRRLFEHRMELGVDESSRRPVVGIVSEEAPLYLSPEKVSSPFNPFARIAREGRKFGVGLLAITQLATLIERQILANFNTLIALRTRSRSDLEFFRDIGLPVETLPFLGDREAFLYTPDLPIKEPIPVYLPGWYEYARWFESSSRTPGRVEENVAEKLANILGEE